MTERMTLAEYRRALGKSMREDDELLPNVIGMARTHGWLVFHPMKCLTPDGSWRTAFAGDPGFPDLVLVRSPQVLFVELKSAKGRVAPDQSKWLAELDGVSTHPHGGCVEVFVWRPAQWISGEIEATLR